jgi:hypothetical protein
MKQIWIIFLVGLFMIGFASFAFTQENKGDMTDMMKGVGEIFQGKTKGKSDACDMIMGKSLVATADGGVIVWLGNKLFKYDKDLVLQKEVEIKIDMESMQKMMKKCSMSGKMKNEVATKEEPK